MTIVIRMLAGLLVLLGRLSRRGKPAHPASRARPGGATTHSDDADNDNVYPLW